MRAVSVVAREIDEAHVGLVVAHDVRTASGTKFVLRKGNRITPDVVEAVRELADHELHLIQPEPHEIHEDEAGARLALALSGPGIRARGPFASEFTFTSEHRGLLRLDRQSLFRVNSLNGITAFTRFDYQPVEAGEDVAGVKVTPLAIPVATIERAEDICAESPPLRVAPFLPYRVGALVTQRVDAPARERFRAVLNLKLSWYGSELASVYESPGSDSPATAIETMLADHPDLIVVAGASSLDPLEPIFRALEEAGATLVRHGVPVDPGSLLWLAYAGDVPILGLPSSEMFSRRTSLELVLPRIFAGETLTRDDLAALGPGGFMRHEMSFRFPNYEGPARGNPLAAAEPSS